MRSSKRDAAGVFGRSRELFEQVVAGWRTPAMPRPPPHMVAGQLRTDTIRSLQKSRTHRRCVAEPRAGQPAAHLRKYELDRSGAEPGRPHPKLRPDGTGSEAPDRAV